MGQYPLVVVGGDRAETQHLHRASQLEQLCQGGMRIPPAWTNVFAPRVADLLRNLVDGALQVGVQKLWAAEEIVDSMAATLHVLLRLKIARAPQGQVRFTLRRV